MPETLTQNIMDDISIYMDSEIREELHFKLAPCKPEIFLKEYIKRDPEFKELVKNEFGIEV